MCEATSFAEMNTGLGGAALQCVGAQFPKMWRERDFRCLGGNALKAKPVYQKPLPTQTPPFGLQFSMDSHLAVAPLLSQMFEASHTLGSGPRSPQAHLARGSWTGMWRRHSSDTQTPHLGRQGQWSEGPAGHGWRHHYTVRIQ